MGETKLELGLFLQIADRMNAESLRLVAPHDERVSVVETKRFGHANAKFLERAFELLQG